MRRAFVAICTVVAVFVIAYTSYALYTYQDGQDHKQKWNAKVFVSIGANDKKQVQELWNQTMQWLSENNIKNPRFHSSESMGKYTIAVVYTK